MKVKDLVSLKGCYSAHDVGELEIPKQVINIEKLAQVIYEVQTKKDQIDLPWDSLNYDSVIKYLPRLQAQAIADYITGEVKL